MKNSFIIILLFVAVFAQAQEKKEVKDMNWKECEERLSKGSAGLTKEELTTCKKKVFKEIKRQQFEEFERLGRSPDNKPPKTKTKSKPIKRLRDDPVALQKHLEKQFREMNKPQPVKKKYEGKHIDIELVASFDDEKEFQKYLKKEQKRPHQVPIRSIRRKGKGSQFIDENGKVIKKIKKTSGKLSKKEREELRAIFEKQIKHLKTPVRKRDVRIIQNKIKNLPIRFRISWGTQQGHLIEAIEYEQVNTAMGKIAYDDYDDEHDYGYLNINTIYSHTNIYDHNGVHKFTLDGDGAAYILPNKECIIGVGVTYAPDTPRTRFTFYDMSGNSVRKLLFGTPEWYFGPLASIVIFSPNGKYIVPAVERDSGINTLTFLNNKGKILWEKKKGEQGYSSPLLVTNNGEVLTKAGHWINKDGVIISKMEEATPPNQIDGRIIDAEEKLLITLYKVDGVQSGYSAKGLLLVTDINTGRVVDNEPPYFFPSDRIKCINNQFLKVLGKGEPHKAIYLYKVRFKK